MPSSGVTMRYVISLSQFLLIKINIFCLVQRHALPQSYVRCGRLFYPLNSGNTVCHLVMSILINILFHSKTCLGAELCALREAILSTRLGEYGCWVLSCGMSSRYVNSHWLKWIYCFIQRHASAQSYVRCGRPFYPLDSGNPVVECYHAVFVFFRYINSHWLKWLHFSYKALWNICAFFFVSV